jgi:hypothetical protein
MYLWTCESNKYAGKVWILKLQIHKLQIRKSQKRLGPQTANPQNAPFADVRNSIIQVCNIECLRFVDVFAEPFLGTVKPFSYMYLIRIRAGLKVD